MKKRLLSILLTACMILSLVPTALAAGSVFTDVKADDWFADEIKYVYENNLMSGVGGNAFDPNGNVSRAMVWTTLARIDGVNTAGSDPWYLVGQKWAVETGVSDGTDPNGIITREQLVTMLYRYVGSPMVSAQQMIVLNTYPDADKISTWAEEAMSWAIDVGMINGIGGNVAPQGVATRAQLATVLYRCVENVVNTEPEPEPEPEPTQPSAPVVPNIPVYPVIPTPPQHIHYYNWVSNENGTHTGTCYAGDDTRVEPCADGDDEDTKCDVCQDELSVYVAAVGGLMYATLPEAIEAAASGEAVNLLKGIDLPTAVVVTKNVTLNLNGKTLTTGNDTAGDGVFHVISGTLTINGEGTVNGVGKSKWCMAIWADGGNVVINGGTYTNVGANTDPGSTQYDLIYAKNGGSVTINGGIFTCQTPNWTLNKHDSTAGKIVVKGGTFTGYNPSESNTENPTANFVAEGYYAIESNGSWTVEAVSGAADSVEELTAALAMGGAVTLGTDIDLPTAVVVTKDVTLNLNGKTLSVTNDTAGDGVFHVTGGTLTINGEGTVNGVGKSKWCMAIWADGGNVVINGGTYTNVGANTDPGSTQYDLIYAKNGGSVTINGGTFTCQTPKWTLNKHDSTGGKIVVKGGTFTGYNPSESNTENPTANFVAEGYYATEESGSWTVKAVSGTADSVEELTAAVKMGGAITLGTDIDLPTAVVVTKDVTLNLNGKTLTVTNDTVGDGVFHVISGTLTINGEGTVNGVGQNNYSMAIWADGGSVIINGGTYTNVGAGSDNHYDLIYAKNGGTVEINGGTFTCQTPKWTLNKHDSTDGKIVVKGGTFLGYNPSASNTENPTANFVAEGYTATESNGTWTVTANAAES